MKKLTTLSSLDLHESIIEWTKKITPSGLYYGYPHHSEPSQVDKMRLKASYLNGEYTGFIPCRFHARQILRGDLKITDLILPYPKSC